jgi:hypothetical protein
MKRAGANGCVAGRPILSALPGCGPSAPVIHIKDIMSLRPSTTDAKRQIAMAGSRSQILNLTFWSLLGVPTGTYSSKDHGEAAARADALDAASRRMRVSKGVKSLSQFSLSRLTSPHRLLPASNGRQTKTDHGVGAGCDRARPPLARGSPPEARLALAALRGPAQPNQALRSRAKAVRCDAVSPAAAGFHWRMSSRPC